MPKNPAITPGPDRRVVRLMLVLMVLLIAPQLDGTVTNVALHTLAGDFRTSLATIQWVSTAYMLATAMLVPVTGWAARRLGDKRLWIIAGLVFLAGSVGAACAWSVGTLICWRVVQGAAAAIETTLMTVMLLKWAGGRNLGSLMATLSLPALIVPILGPLAGGAIITHASWRWIFWLNVPISIAGVWLAAKFLPRDEPTAPQPFDAIGLGLASSGVVGLLYGVTRVGQMGRIDTLATALGGAGVLLLVAFVLRTKRRTAPVIDLGVFGLRSFAIGTAVVTAVSFALYGATLLLPLFWQMLRGATPLVAGAALIPQALGSLVTRRWAGQMTDRIGARWVVVASGAITTLGTVPFVFLRGDAPWWLLALVLFVRGLGLGGLFMPLTLA